MDFSPKLTMERALSLIVRALNNQEKPVAEKLSLAINYIFRMEDGEAKKELSVLVGDESTPQDEALLQQIRTVCKKHAPEQGRSLG